MMGRPTGCSTHRPALAAFAERSERGPGTAAAFDHLERCRRCEAELTEALLTVHAVRRLLADARVADPPPDAWARLRLRVQRPVAGAWRARSSLAGVVLGAGLVAALIGPTAVVPRQEVTGREPGPDASVARVQTQLDLLAESAFLSRIRAAPPHPTTVPEVVPPAYWRGPDGLGRVSAPVRVDIPPERAD
jgi:hypothetical protein